MTKKPTGSQVSEKEWTRTVLVPLLRRLGFFSVDYTHGASEHGRDVVFADFDRFGLARYHAAQVKMGNIGVDGLPRLIDRLRSAWMTPYVDPATGTEHRISTVYLVASGSITDQARVELAGQTGSWLFVVDGDRLDLADQRLAVFVSAEERHARLTRAMVEIAAEVIPNVTATRDDLVRFLAMADRHWRKIEAAPMASDFRLPWLLPNHSLDRVLDVATTELSPRDTTLLTMFSRAIRQFNSFIARLPLGRLEVHSEDARNWRGLRSWCDEVLFRAEQAQTILQYLREADRPPPGEQLPRCPDVVDEVLDAAIDNDGDGE